MVQSSSLDIYILLLGGTLMTFLLAGGMVAFMVSYKRRLLQQNLQMREMEIKHQQDLFYSNLESMENERKRISQDLHDEVGAALSTTRLLVSQIEENTNSPKSNVFSEEAKQMIDNTIANVRRISNDMLPLGLEDFGLEYAIEELCDKIMMASKIEIDFEPQELQRFDVKKELVIYRIVQELLNNTLKHAHATKVDVYMVKSSTLAIIYHDNGIGFEYPVPHKKAGLGVKNVESRVKMLNGEITILTKPNEGMKVDIIIPIAELFAKRIDIHD
jgi:signal transduction histidine kinase